MAEKDPTEPLRYSWFVILFLPVVSGTWLAAAYLGWQWIPMGLSLLFGLLAFSQRREQAWDRAEVDAGRKYSCGCPTSYVVQHREHRPGCSVNRTLRVEE